VSGRASDAGTTVTADRKTQSFQDSWSAAAGEFGRAKVFEIDIDIYEHIYIYICVCGGVYWCAGVGVVKNISTYICAFIYLSIWSAAAGEFVRAKVL